MALTGGRSVLSDLAAQGGAKQPTCGGQGCVSGCRQARLSVAPGAAAGHTAMDAAPPARPSATPRAVLQIPVACLAPRATTTRHPPAGAATSRHEPPARCAVARTPHRRGLGGDPPRRRGSPAAWPGGGACAGSPAPRPSCWAGGEPCRAPARVAHSPVVEKRCGGRAAWHLRSSHIALRPLRLPLSSTISPCERLCTADVGGL